MLAGQLVVYLGVRLAEADRPVTAVAGGLLLLDDIGLDRHREVVRLAGEIGRLVVIHPVLLEGAVAQVGPQHRDHPEFVGALERLADLADLPSRLR